jgi:hypothetical protein
VYPRARSGLGEPHAAAAADEESGGGEGTQPETSGFPASGRAGEGEHLHPGQQFAYQRGDLAPELLLLTTMQCQVTQAGVLLIAVLVPGLAPVPQSRKLPPLVLVAMRVNWCPSRSAIRPASIAVVTAPEPDDLFGDVGPTRVGGVDSEEARP